MGEWVKQIQDQSGNEGSGMKTNSKWNAWWLFCTVGVFAFTLTAQAASFDCAKAGTKVEHMICDNAEISILDEKLGQDYQQAITKSAENRKQEIITEQKAWLKERNRCSDEACLEATYEKRLVSLGVLSSRPYMLVMSLDSTLCHSMLDLYNSDMAASGQINYDDHEMFSAIDWEPIDPDYEKAVFDINNDEKDETVIKFSGHVLATNLDSLQIYLPDQQIFAKANNGGRGRLLDTPNSLFEGPPSIYYLKEVPEQLKKTILEYKLNHLPKYLRNVNLRDLRKDFEQPYIAGGFVVQPFKWNTIYYVSITSYNDPEWIVIAKYKEAKDVKDICYFYDQSHRFAFLNSN